MDARGTPAVDGNAGKRARLETDDPDFFDCLADDLVHLVLCKLSSSASRPADLLTVLATCKRLNELARHPTVFSSASPGALAIRASRWCGPAHSYLKRCADLGNADACYTLGMIMVYCLNDHKGGIGMLAKAGMRRHAAALYSLSVIHFNGSGALRGAQAIHGGAVLCARAALLGHLDALRELGHCLLDGYGVRRDPVRGRRCLMQANARELGLVGRYLPAARGDRVSRFLLEWFGSKGGVEEEGLRMCSHEACGRRELRRQEFRRCSACVGVNYCSRTCQEIDWRLRHKTQCRWRAAIGGGGDGGEGGAGYQGRLLGREGELQGR